MIVTLVTDAPGTANAVAFRLDPLREAPWTLDAVLDEIDRASTDSGRYIVIRDEHARLTTIVDRGHVVAIVLPDDVDGVNSGGLIVPLTGTVDQPAVHRRETAPKEHPAL